MSEKLVKLDDLENKERIKEKQLIIAAGSPSTLFAIAMYCQANGINPDMIGKDKKVDIIITQAFQVGKGSLARETLKTLEEGKKVVTIGLAVNNRDPKMTKDLFELIGKDKLAGVYDEHSSKDWESLQKDLEFSSDKFNCIERNDENLSVASIIAKKFPGKSNELWRLAGDWLDNRSIKVADEVKELARMVDCAVKAKIADNEFRLTAIKYLLGDPETVEVFNERAKFGQELKKPIKNAIENGEKHGLVLVIRQPSDIELNATDIMFEGYEKSPFVAVVGKKSGEPELGVTIGCDNTHPKFGKTNLLEILKSAGLIVSGMASKATVLGEENLPLVLEALNKLDE